MTDWTEPDDFDPSPDEPHPLALPFHDEAEMLERRPPEEYGCACVEDCDEDCPCAGECCGFCPCDCGDG